MMTPLTVIAMGGSDAVFAAIPAILIALVAGTLSVIAVVVASQARGAVRDRDLRLNRMESRLQALERRQVGAAVSTEAPVAPPVAPPTAAAMRAPLGPAIVLGAHSEFPPAAARPSTAPPTAIAPPMATTLHPAPDRAVASAPSWEERLGSRLFVWIGGVALVLAGAFLVKYSFDNGLLSPGVRLLFATGFGVALIAAGEWLRTRSARVAAALAAAGVADLFAVLLAATRLYDYLTPTVGFTLMAVLTGGAVVLSLRHGQFVALLGLLGGFITPALISDGPGTPGPLFTYLLLLEVGLLFVTGRRGWVGLTTLTLLGSLAWALIFGVFLGGEAAQRWAGPFVLLSAAAYVASAARMTSASPAASPIALGLAGVVGSVALLALLSLYGSFSLVEFGLVALLGAGTLVLARLDPRYTPLPAVAAAVSLLMLAAWSTRDDAPLPTTLALLLLGFGALYALGSYAAMWRSGVAAWWATLSVAAAHAYLVAAFVVVNDAPPARLPWWAIALALAALLASLAAPVRRHAFEVTRPLAALALGAAGFMTWSAAAGLEHPWAAVGWATLAAAAAWTAAVLRVHALRWSVAWLAPLATLLLIVPGPLSMPLGERILLNPLLPQYGIPALAFAAAAVALRRIGSIGFAGAAAALGVASAMALVTLVIRHTFHRADLLDDEVRLFEWSTYALAWGGIGVTVLALGRNAAAARQIGGGFVAIAAALALGGAGLLANPLWTHEAVGPLPLANGLLYLYGLPLLVTTAAALLLMRSGELPGSRVFAAASVLLSFALVSLLVRQGFVGTFLDLESTGVSNAEWYAYSLVWIVLGLALLACGAWLRSPVLRYASLAVMLLAVAKVFVLDAAQLRDLWRVLSFLGLGVSLLGLGYVYQRFVFSRPAATPA